LTQLLATLCATVLRMVAAIGMLAILARALPIEMFAALSVGLLVGQLLSILIDGGVNNEMLRFAGVESAQQHRARLDESTAVRLLVMPLPLSFLFGVSAFLEGLQAAQIITLAALATLLGSLGESYFMSLRATGRWRAELGRTVVLTILMLTLPWLARLWPSAAGLCVFLPRLFSLIDLLDSPRRRVLQALRQHASRDAVTIYYRRIRHYSVDSIISNLGMQLDGLLIMTLLGKQAYAIYQPTSRLFVSAMSLGSVVAGLVMPRAARLEPPIRARSYLLSCFSAAGLVVAATLGPLLLWGVGPLFGANFQLEPPVAMLLCALALARFIAAGSGSYLTLRGQQKYRARVNAINTLAIVPAVLWLAHSIESVLLALLVSQVLMAIFYTIRSIRSESNA
jgi:O-antigen/teichoic acid export membrane protein